VLLGTARYCPAALLEKRENLWPITCKFCVLAGTRRHSWQFFTKILKLNTPYVTTNLRQMFILNVCYGRYAGRFIAEPTMSLTLIINLKVKIVIRSLSSGLVYRAILTRPDQWRKIWAISSMLFAKPAKWLC